MSQEHEAALRRMVGAMNAQPGIEAADRALRDALERARVVGVLDAWVARRTYNARRYESQLDVCVLVDCDAGQRIFTGADQDAARAAAARAIEAGEVAP